MTIDLVLFKCGWFIKIETISSPNDFQSGLNQQNTIKLLFIEKILFSNYHKHNGDQHTINVIM
jgi:hypothetical protein